ncbi:MAG: hypothetical protein PVF77_07750, partial [Anaerolineae bacterium]
MQASRWPYILILVLLAAILAACSLLSSEQPSAGILPEQPTLPIPTVIGVPTPEKVSPFPEYRLDLTLDPAQRRLAGKQQVIVPNHTGQDLDELVFRLYPNLPQYGGRMSVGPVWVDGQRGTSSLRAGDTSLVVPLEQPLAQEKSVTVELTFDLDIPLKESGNALFGYSQGVWSVPDGYALLAAHDGSTWSEDTAPPHGDAVTADVGFYDVTLTLPPTLTLVSTGSVLSQTLDTAGQYAYRIGGGPFREFAWLASTDYQVAETTAYG